MEEFIGIVVDAANGNIDSILIDDLENAYLKAVKENPENEEFLFALKQTLIENAAYLKPINR